MEQDQITIYSYSLTYRFLSENEKPWKGDIKKEIEYELLIKPNPSLKKIETLLKKNSKEYQNWNNYISTPFHHGKLQLKT